MKYFHNSKFIILIFLILLFISVVESVRAEDNVLRLGIPAKKAGTAMYYAWEPIVSELERITDIPLKLVIVKDHEELTQKMGKGEVEIGYFSPVPYVFAHQEINCQPLVMRVKYDSPFYETGFIVPADSKIESLQDLKGKIVALTNAEDSTSGYYVPLAMLQEAGINPREDLEQIIYTGKHINVLKIVSFRQVDAGAIKLYILQDEDNSNYRDKIKVIAVSRFLPGSTIAVRSDLSLELQNKLKEGFLDMSLYKSGREALKHMDFNGFVPASDSLYRLIRKYLLILDKDIEE